MRRRTGHDPYQLMLFDDDFLQATGGLAEQPGSDGLPSGVVVSAVIPGGRAKSRRCQASSEPATGLGCGFRRTVPGQAAMTHPGLLCAEVDTPQRAPGARHVRPVVFRRRRHEVAHVTRPQRGAARGDVRRGRLQFSVSAPEKLETKCTVLVIAATRFRAMAAINVRCDRSARLFSLGSCPHAQRRPMRDIL